MPQARCARPPPTAQRAARLQCNMKTAFQLALRLAQGLLWLVALAGSALLVYWLYLDPIYDRNWSAAFGALLFAVLAVYAGIGWLVSLIDVRAPPVDRWGERRVDRSHGHRQRSPALRH